jgi:hypothetical protein
MEPCAPITTPASNSQHAMGAMTDHAGIPTADLASSRAVADSVFELVMSRADFAEGRTVARSSSSDKRAFANNGRGCGGSRQAFRLISGCRNLGLPQWGRQGQRFLPAQVAEFVKVHSACICMSIISPLTIHGQPNLSVTMPKRLAQNVGPKGMVTLPPSASALNTLSARATAS